MLFTACLHGFRVLPASWHRTDERCAAVLSKIVNPPTGQEDEGPLSTVVLFCARVSANRLENLFVRGRRVCLSDCQKRLGRRFLDVDVTPASISAFVNDMEKYAICIGNPEAEYIEFFGAKKGNLRNRSGAVSATLDSHSPFMVEGRLYVNTIRTTDCHLLLTSGKTTRCRPCIRFRLALRMMASRARKARSLHTGNSFLRSPFLRAKLSALARERKTSLQRIRRMEAAIECMNEESSVDVDEELHGDLTSIASEYESTISQTYAEGSFRRLFWDQQLKAAKSKGSRGMRWHPDMIRWALNIRLRSAGAYHDMRTAGFITLPSERTLRDYTHVFENRVGFQFEVNDLLAAEAKSNAAGHKHVVLIFDEMKVKEDLVYNKHSVRVVGFTSLTNVEDRLQKLERRCGSRPDVARYILVVMIRGLTSSLRFPYAHFATVGATSEILSSVIWEAVRQVEMVGLKVIGITADGAASNRKFFRNFCDTPGGHKGVNPYSADGQPIYFFSDVPHLIKTTRNCWSHSFENGSVRAMTVRHR